jgi:hypothetical protein
LGLCSQRCKQHSSQQKRESALRHNRHSLPRNGCERSEDVARSTSTSSALPTRSTIAGLATTSSSTGMRSRPGWTPTRSLDRHAAAPDPADPAGLSASGSVNTRATAVAPCCRS